MATTIALLVDPDNRTGMVDGTNAQAAAHAIGLRTRIFEVRAGREIDAVFATLANERPDALYVNPDALFFNERNRLVALSARYAIPAIYADRESAEAGGLLSYGASRTDAYRQAGSYVGRILKGEKPGDTASRVADQISTGDQPQDRQGAWPHDPRQAARPRRRGG